MKKLILSLALVTAIAIGVVGMSAFEAHVVNVTATINNATEISTDQIAFGTTFPQEELHSPVTLYLSDAFRASNALGVDYKIKQKPKCVNEAGAYAQVTEDPANPDFFVCPQDYEMMPLLCPFLSKTSQRSGDTSVPSFHGPILANAWTNEVSEQFKAVGHLTQDAYSNEWDIDLHTPCFEGQCGQDWAAYVQGANAGADPNAYLIPEDLKEEQLGCDLWFELTAVNRPI